MSVKKFEINALTLHILAMTFMVIDHSWATIVEGHMWMNFAGRLAFPIFAFMTAEGFFKTGNLKNYMKRMLILAVLSEIPFNLMNSGNVFDPFHQNVIWTFLIALAGMYWFEKIRRRKQSRWKIILSCTGVAILGFLAGTLGMTDYSGTGVLTVFIFYFFHGRKWTDYLGQAAGMYLINFVLIKNMDIPVMLMGHEFFFPTQGFAIFALVFIWLYKGRQGPHNKVIQYSCYAFYPVHILILSLLALGGF